MAPSVRQPPGSLPLTQVQLYACIPLALLAYLVIKPLVQTLLSPLRSVPGPFLARFTRLWELYVMRKRDFAIYNIELHEKYGPIVRLAPNRYSINDADAAKIILGHHDALDKSAYYWPFGSPFETNTFSEPGIAAHAKMRRPIAGLYSNTQLAMYEPFVDTCNSILLKRLKEYTSSGKELDVREMMQFYAFDVIGEITMGSRFGFMEDDGDNYGIISEIDGSINYGANVGLVPELHTLMGYMIKLFKITNSTLRVNNFVDTRIEDRANGRTKSPQDREDFIDKLLPLEAAGKATRLHTQFACQQNVGAGSDTTAISLTATIYFLTTHPSKLAKLRAELDDAKARGELSDPITFKQAQKLPYLQAVIQESLRLHPAVGAPLARVVRPGGATFAGHFFPAGTEVGVNAWVHHRNKSVYGPDAEQFRPERWLTDNAEERSHLDRNLLSFGGGPRVCMGRNISLLEMSKVVPQMVRRFEFELVANDGRAKGEAEWEGGYKWRTFWFTKQDFKCVVKDRKV